MIWRDLICGRGIGLPSQSGALQPSQARQFSGRITLPRRVAIGFAFMGDQMGVGSAQHDIECIGMRRSDRRHRLDHRLDPLVRGEQAEGQDDRGRAATARATSVIAASARQGNSIVRPRA